MDRVAFRERSNLNVRKTRKFLKTVANVCVWERTRKGIHLISPREERVYSTDFKTLQFEGVSQASHKIKYYIK